MDPGRRGAMKVAITGGAGFIGANLGRALLARPEVTQVVAVDDLSTGFEANLAGTGVELQKATILDPSALDHAFAGASSVVHLAAIPSVPRSIVDPVSSHTVNATGTVEVLQAARRAGVDHIVVASSSSVYGAQRELPKRETMRTDPISPYAVSKLAAEMYALSFARSYDLKVLAIRFFNVFGAFQSAGHAYAAVTPNFVLAALTNQPLVVHGDGEQTRDFTYVGTLCEVISDAVVRRISCDGAMNGAFGSRTSLNEYVAVLSDVVGKPLQIEYTDPRTGDVRDSQADTSRISALFPDIEPVRLREGLEKTVDWYRAHLRETGGDYATE
jgi:UDP-glucose 4-epimerase